MSNRTHFDRKLCKHSPFFDDEWFLLILNIQRENHEGIVENAQEKCTEASFFSWQVKQTISSGLDDDCEMSRVMMTKPERTYS